MSEISCRLCSSGVGKTLPELRAHGQTHTAEFATHRCAFCVTRCAARKALDDHMRRQHLDYPCADCGGVFDGNSRFQAHRREAEKEGRPCGPKKRRLNDTWPKPKTPRRRPTQTPAPRMDTPFPGPVEAKPSPGDLHSVEERPEEPEEEEEEIGTVDVGVEAAAMVDGGGAFAQLLALVQKEQELEESRTRREEDRGLWRRGLIQDLASRLPGATARL